MTVKGVLKKTKDTNVRVAPLGGNQNNNAGEWINQDDTTAIVGQGAIDVTTQTAFDRTFQPGELAGLTFSIVLPRPIGADKFSVTVTSNGKQWSDPSVADKLVWVFLLS